MKIFSCKSERSADFLDFAKKAVEFIDTYTVPQYGDKGKDLATNYTTDQCLQQIKKYTNRHGKNARANQDGQDLLKIAHYAQLAYSSIQNGKT